MTYDVEMIQITTTAGADMYEYDINTPLPDADYRGPIFGAGWKPAERETFAEALDRKCTEVHEYNENYRKTH